MGDEHTAECQGDQGKYDPIWRGDGLPDQIEQE